MKKAFWSVLILLLTISLSGCASRAGRADGDADEAVAVADLVEDFGRRLQRVSLQAPRDIVSKSMEENYGDLVSSSLLAAWISEPSKAPGRMVSSPWPDRIEMLSAEKLSADTYEVKGEIIEITSVEKVSGGFAARRPITLVIKKARGRWLIDAVKLGACAETGSIVYENTRYGFSFSLPESWKGYSIEIGQWEGWACGGPRSGEIVETGPEILIRHPRWTSENPRQDIPIMVFTLAQWNALQRMELAVSAAPVGPRELGRNARYVFALPARYNYAFPPGYEEVEEILRSDPLQANDG